jgi:hypothetical protein
MDLIGRFYLSHPAHAAEWRAAWADCLPVVQTMFLTHLADIAVWARAEQFITEADKEALLDRAQCRFF